MITTLIDSADISELKQPRTAEEWEPFIGIKGAVSNSDASHNGRISGCTLVSIKGDVATILPPGHGHSEKAPISKLRLQRKAILNGRAHNNVSDTRIIQMTKPGNLDRWVVSIPGHKFLGGNRSKYTLDSSLESARTYPTKNAAYQCKKEITSHFPELGEVVPRYLTKAKALEEIKAHEWRDRSPEECTAAHQAKEMVAKVIDKPLTDIFNKPEPRQDVVPFPASPQGQPVSPLVPIAPASIDPAIFESWEVARREESAAEAMFLQAKAERIKREAHLEIMSRRHALGI